MPIFNYNLLLLKKSSFLGKRKLKSFANVKTINTFARTKKEAKTFFIACKNKIKSLKNDGHLVG